MASAEHERGHGDAEIRGLADECVHCGFCLPTCPTYVLWGEEMDSPRGRLQLMKAEVDGRVSFDSSVVRRMDACLGCLACVTACPSGVEYGPLIEQARSKGIEVVRVKKGNEREFGATRVRVLRPGVGAESTTERNNLSMVLSLQFRENQFLLTGDVEALAEIALGRELREGHLEVLKVAHHGSRGSTSEIFLEQTRPMFAMISAGFDNTYRHPHEELLERLRRTKTAVLRTDLDGAISIFSDGHQLELRRFATNR